jgi:hypothetical protein
VRGIDSCSAVRRRCFLAALFLTLTAAACGPLLPPAEVTVANADLADLAQQIKVELEDDRCSQLFVIGQVRITSAELMRGDEGAEVLEVRGRALTQLADSADLNALACNTLSVRRRVDAIRALGPGASSETDVRAYFTEQSSGWVIEAADFDD